MDFENRVLRRISGPKRDEMIGIKSRRMRWAGHVARMGEIIGGKARKMLEREDGEIYTG
jgi:hypothetical protein